MNSFSEFYQRRSALTFAIISLYVYYWSVDSCQDKQTGNTFKFYFNEILLYLSIQI